MNNDFSLKKLLFKGGLSLIIALTIVFLSIIDRRTKIVFCDVGQGDAAYIRIKNKTDVVIDAGPNRKILLCLGKHMPFYDRKIELAIISHPQTDHFGGFLELIDRYQIEKIILPSIDNSNKSFNLLKSKILNKKIFTLFLKAGNKITINNDQLSFYWPTEDFLNRSLVYDKPRQLNKHILGVSSIDLNYFSYIFMFEENNFRALFTGDAPPAVLASIMRNESVNHLKNTNILKIPHHGSKNGLTEMFLKLANPQVVVISVGRNNSFGHPTKEILDMLQASSTQIRRTDEEGDIIFRIQNPKVKIQNYK